MDLELPCSIKGVHLFVAALTCWPEFEFHFGKLDFFPRRQGQLLRVVLPLVAVSRETQLGGGLSLAIRHGRWLIEEVRRDVLERDLLLADVANPHDELDRFAVAVGPLLAEAEAQAGLQAIDFLAHVQAAAAEFLAPCGEAL